jgi:hypothetical protein
VPPSPPPCNRHSPPPAASRSASERWGAAAASLAVSLRTSGAFVQRPRRGLKASPTSDPSVPCKPTQRETNLWVVVCSRGRAGKQPKRGSAQAARRRRRREDRRLAWPLMDADARLLADALSADAPHGVRLSPSRCRTNGQRGLSVQVLRSLRVLSSFAPPGRSTVERDGPLGSAYLVGGACPAAKNAAARKPPAFQPREGQFGRRGLPVREPVWDSRLSHATPSPERIGARAVDHLDSRGERKGHRHRGFASRAVTAPVRARVRFSVARALVHERHDARVGCPNVAYLPLLRY